MRRCLTHCIIINRRDVGKENCLFFFIFFGVHRTICSRTSYNDIVPDTNRRRHIVRYSWSPIYYDKNIDNIVSDANRLIPSARVSSLSPPHTRSHRRRRPNDRSKSFSSVSHTRSPSLTRHIRLVNIFRPTKPSYYCQTSVACRGLSVRCPGDRSGTCAGAASICSPARTARGRNRFHGRRCVHTLRWRENEII